MRGHIRKRGKTWAVVYDVGRDTATGKRKQRWQSGFATKRDAEAALTEAKSRLQSGTDVEPTKQTAGEFLDEWLEAVSVRLRPSTHASYASNVRLHVKPKIGGLPLQRLSTGHLNAMYAELLAPKEDRPLSPRTVRYVHAIVHHALRDAVKWNRLVRNVADAADPPKPDKPEIRRWSADELNRFLASVRDDRLYAAYRLIATTGLRRGEALGLRWSDVDLDAGTIAIRQTLLAPGYKLAVSKPKTKRSERAVALDPATVETLRAHRKAQLEERLAFGPAYPATLATFGDLVFREADGQPVNPARFGKTFERTVAKLDVPPIPLHGLRHTWATLALTQGIHPKVVSERLGHSTISITLDTYSDVMPGMQEEAAAKVAALIVG